MTRLFKTVLTVVSVVVFTPAAGPRHVHAQSAPAPAAQPAAPVVLAAADAKAVLGDWTIVAEGMQGPATFTLTLEADGEKTLGELTSDVMASTAITDITRTGETVLLRYWFDYEGNQIPTVVSLTPAGEGLEVVFDFADGAYLMSGTATRKKS
jgi:hypothetical protein